ncbi:Mediator of RNA polymerase II transcription subunit 15a [Vitis vinifera]|uniref:Mediator of RNA polymerase II transcription subunit 15a n=2 Tax=Vitis vinifera TaxID=29760 RepID=A0A438DN09_VITVI|nr:Mediator of RNA polymerase II transcription subunit 15a [Vitis vinifera]
MNNQRPAQAEPVMDISPDSRQLMVNKIMDKLKRHVPVSTPVELHELRKVAERFENKIYSTSRWQLEYIRKLSLKMLELETKSFNAAINSLPSSPAARSRESLRSR